MEISGEDASCNTIQGNWIGLDISGRQGLANAGSGLVLVGSGHRIEANAIAGNGGHGVVLADSATAIRIQDNDIGVGVQDKLVPNAGDGIWVSAHAARDTLGPDNRIWGNWGWGIALTDSTAQGILITQNSLSGNGEGAIDLAPGANGGIAAPEVISAQPPAGTAPAGATVEIFSDSAGQALTYEATVTADGAGEWHWDGTASGPYVTAVAIDAQGNSSALARVLNVSVEDGSGVAQPSDFVLHQNYPNPFNPVTTVAYDLPVRCHVNVTIYNLLGRRVARLVDGMQDAGRYRVTFDASFLPSGLYFCQIEAQSYRAVQKMVLLE